MGATCCVAAKSKPVSDELNVLTARTGNRCSPSWNVRWDNQGRVAGEETGRWFADRDSQLGNISETEVRTLSERECPENLQPLAWSRSPLPEEGIHVPYFRSPNLDASISQAISLEGKDATNIRAAPDISPSPMMASVSVSTSSLPKRDHLLHASSTPARLTCLIQGNHLCTQTTDGGMAGFKSPGTYRERPSPRRSVWTNHSARGSRDESSDSCSITEYMPYPNRERWSFDSDSFHLNNQDTITRSSSRGSFSPCLHIKTCGACSKLLSDESSFGSQKLMSTNELAVVAVLVCGHVYHAECLEHMTQEASKYDPACPVCTFGEQQAMKFSEKTTKIEMESRLKHRKRSRSRIVDSEFESLIVDDVGKDVKIDSSSGVKNFFKRHLSLGSKGNKPISANPSSKKKSLSWT